MAFSDLLDGAGDFLDQAGDVALKGQTLFNQFSGQTVPAPGPQLAAAPPSAQAYTPAAPIEGGMPTWVWGAGIGLVALVLLGFIWSGRKKG